MAYALRYYKELTHADGTVIRLEIHKKDSTTSAVEIGAVVQRLSLEIQGQQDDIDSPIQKTSLHMTFVDASDIENGQKNGFWQEFYTPDALMWKVILKAKDAKETSFRTIWGGYVTPDSFSEDLVYRGSVSITARDNIGHMQDFPFDAEGDADGMISLYNLVESGWEKIQSPMMLEWRGNAESTMWLEVDGVSAMFTLMNVSMFEGMDWYKAIETALASYGVVMRYIGNNIVKMSSLRSMPYQGAENIEDLIHIEPTFVSGATRELIPAVKRIEESVDYDFEEIVFEKLPQSSFTGDIERFEVAGVTYEKSGIAWTIDKKESGSGWCCPRNSMFFNADQYPFFQDEDGDARYNFLVCNTYGLEGSVGYRYAEYSRPYYFPATLTFDLRLGRPYMLNTNGNLMPYYQLENVSVAVIVEYLGASYYLQKDGSWDTVAVSHVLSSDNLSLQIPAADFTGRGMMKIQIHHIKTSSNSKGIGQYIPLYSATLTHSMSLREKNTVNTNYDASNNVILSRDPEIGPAFDKVALPRIIKNGIFYRQGDVILPARKWSWGSGSEQQMAVWNHLQLLSYYAKPNNLISGTIVNADITRAKAIYMWHGAEHILVSGTYNFLNGHIESAMLREFARYEDMWSEVAGAGLPDTEQDSRSNVEGGASGGGASSTYTNTTTVNIGSGGGGTGASYLNDLLDVDTTGVVAQSVLYYNGTSWVDMSLPTLLNPYLKADIAAQTYAKSSDLSALTTRVGANEGSIASLQSGKADKATTLAGYGIKDAYTTTQVDEKISDLDESKADKTELEKYLLLESENQTIKGNIRIEGNLIVTGDTATGGEGGSVPVGITGILVDGMTYRDKNADGVIDITDAFEGLQEKIDLTNYYTRVEVDAQVSAINNEVSGKASQSDLDSVSGRVSTLENAGYATQTYVNTAINNLNIGQYATKTYVGEQITALNIGQYLKSATAESTYAKITSLTAVDNRLKGIEAYFATSEDAGTQIDKWNEIVAFLDATEGTTLAGILEAYTLKSVYEAFVSSTNTALADRYTKTQTNSAISTALASYYTKNEIDGKVTTINNALADRYTKTQVDGIVTTINNSITSVDNKYAHTKTWADTLASLIVNENGNIRIKTNLIVNGDTASGGGSGETAIGITGIILNGVTYRDENSDGIIDLGTITSGLTSVNWSDVQGRPTSLSQFNNDLGLGTLAYKNGLTASDIPDLSGIYLPRTGGTINGSLQIVNDSGAINYYNSNLNQSGWLFYGGGSNWYVTNNGWQNNFLLLHSGNYSSYALPLSGGTIKSTTDGAPIHLETTTQKYCAISFKGNVGGKAYLLYSGETDEWAVTTANWGKTNTILTSAGGNLVGDLTFLSNRSVRIKPYSATANGGGWANRGLTFVNENDTELGGIYAHGNNNQLSYIYIGTQSYNGVNLRIGNGILDWGDNHVLHSGNIGSYKSGDSDKLGGYSLNNIIQWIGVDASHPLDLNEMYSELAIMRAYWAYAGSSHVSNQPWSSSAASVWTLPSYYPLQIAKLYASNDIRVRGKAGNEWSDWKQIAFTDSDITGKAGGLRLAKTTDLNNIPTDMSSYAIDYVMGISLNAPANHPFGFLHQYKWDNGNWHSQLYFTVSDFGNKLYSRGYRDDTKEWTAWREFAFTDSNVASATYASTARILVDAQGGKSVAYVSGNTFYIGDSIYPTTSTHILGNDVRLRYGANAATGLFLNTSGNVTIGGSDLAGTSAKLVVDNGDIVINSIYRSLVFKETAYLKSYGNKRFLIHNTNGLFLGLETTDTPTEIYGKSISLIANTSVKGTLSVTGAVTMSSTLSVGGASTFNGDVRINGNLIVTGDTASGGTAGTTTGGAQLLILNNDIPMGTSVAQSTLDAIGLTLQVIDDLIDGKYHHMALHVNNWSGLFTISGDRSSSSRSLFFHYGAEQADTSITYFLHQYNGGNWEIIYREM